jgi:hypothetical protein
MLSARFGVVGDVLQHDVLIHHRGHVREHSGHLVVLHGKAPSYPPFPTRANTLNCECLDCKSLNIQSIFGLIRRD